MHQTHVPLNTISQIATDLQIRLEGCLGCCSGLPAMAARGDGRRFKFGLWICTALGFSVQLLFYDLSFRHP